MIILGVRETLRLIDGGKTGNQSYPVIQALGQISERVAFTAPALAFAADVIAGVAAPAQLRLQNKLDEILHFGREEVAADPAGMPRYTILPFGRVEARIFPRLRVALEGRAGPFMLQTLAIAYLADASLLLENEEDNRQIMEQLKVSGISIEAAWVSWRET